MDPSVKDLIAEIDRVRPKLYELGGYGLGNLLDDCRTALESAPKAEPEQLTDPYLRELWREAGGEFYGPNVETGCMPEKALFAFLRAIAESAPKHQQGDLSVPSAGVLPHPESGWICPACGHSNAPSNRECGCRGNKTLRERISTP